MTLVSVAFSQLTDENGVSVSQDPLTLAQARLDAATSGRLWWREDGGKSLVPLYENELAQAKALAAAQQPGTTPGSAQE